MEQGHQTGIVVMSRMELLAKLKENREKHVAEYDEAMDSFKEVALQQLTKEWDRIGSVLAEIKDSISKRIDEFDPRNPGIEDKFQFIIPGKSMSMDIPKSHAEDYDAAIDRATHDHRDFIPLTELQFDQFVRDKWHWQTEFRTTVASYSKHKL